jgi:hypothetical protein
VFQFPNLSSVGTDLQGPVSSVVRNSLRVRENCRQPVLWGRLPEVCCRKSVPKNRSGNQPSRIAVPTGPGTRAVDQTAPGDCSRSCTCRPSLHQPRGRHGSFLSPSVAVTTSDQPPQGCSSELSERLQSQWFRWLLAGGLRSPPEVSPMVGR